MEGATRKHVNPEYAATTRDYFSTHMQVSANIVDMVPLYRGMCFQPRKFSKGRTLGLWQAWRSTTVLMPKKKLQFLLDRAEHGS